MGNRAYLRHLEQLFLLEVLVERVDIERPCCVPIKVNCQFIDLLPFEIDQQEFRSELDAAAAAVEASAAAAADMGYECPDTCIPMPEPPGKIGTGKSCLFPMLPLELIKCLKRYPLILKVFRNMGDCCDGEIFEHLGTANVNLGLPHFCDTIRRSTICGERLPLVGCMANVYPLYKEDEKERSVECGTIEIFIRISCFGHNILTHFQLLGAERAFVFKNSDNDEEKKCLICPKDNKPPCQQVIETDVSPYKPCPADDLWLEQESQCVLGPRFAEQQVEWGLKGAKLHPPNQPVCSSSGGLRPGECCQGQGQPCVPKCPADQSNDNCNCPPCLNEPPPMCHIPECKSSPKEPTYCTPSCPPGSGHCPPGSGHCPASSGNCPSGSRHCPETEHCPPGSGHCPVGSGHCPPGSGHCPPGSGHCQPGTSHNSPPDNSCCCGSSSPQLNLELCPPQSGCPFVPAPPPCNPPKPSVCTPNPYLQKNAPASQNYYMEYIQNKESNAHNGIQHKEEIVQEIEKHEVASACPPPRENHSTGCGPCPPKAPFGCVIPEKPICPGLGSCPAGACPSPPPLCPPPLKGSENWPPTPNVNIPCPLSCDVHKLSLPEEMKCCPVECHDQENKVPIRYDTTGKLSPAFMGDKLRIPLPRLHPPVRYDTTGALSPAFMGNIYDTSKQHPPVRYDTTGALSPAYQWSLKPPKLEGKRPCPGGCGGYEADSDDPNGATCACKRLMGASSDESDKICDCADWGGMDVTYDFTPVKPLRPEGMGPLEPYASFDGECVCRSKEEYSPKFPGKAFCAERDPKLDMPKQENEPNIKSEGVKHEESVRPKSEKDSEICKDVQKSVKSKRHKQKHRPGVPRSKKIKNIFRGRYVNKIGLHYPGLHVGHEHCMTKYPHVPSTMGWLWNLRQTVFGLKFRPGWRPGSIAKTVMSIIEGKEIPPVATRGRRALMGTDSKSTTRSRSGKLQSGSTKDENISPTLHLHRRNGAYSISMRPVNINSETEADPLQFKIPGCPKEDGSTEYESDTSSELEIKFLAPGSLFQPKKVDPTFKSLGTQVNDKDILKATGWKKKGKGKGGKGGKGGRGGAGEGADGKNKYGAGGGASMVYQPKICQDEPPTPCWDPCNSWMETCQNPCNMYNPCYPCYPACYH